MEFNFKANPLPWKKQEDSPFDIVLDANNQEVFILASSYKQLGGPEGLAKFLVDLVNKNFVPSTTSPSINPVVNKDK